MGQKRNKWARIVSGHAIILALVSLVACSGSPSEPDPIAVQVLTDIAPPLACPEPELRRPPADLVAPLGLAAPELLPAGQGDYGMSREGVESLVDILRSAGERLARWRAWATP